MILTPRRASSIALVLFALTLSAPARDDSKPQVAPAPRARVTDVPNDLRGSLKLDPFYQKYTSAGGIPVLSSDKASDQGLLEAAYLIQQVLAERPEILREMVRRGVRFVVMAPTEMTTDVPEQRDMTPKDYWDKRARGLGGRITSCGEENLLNLKGDRYRNENILVHEFSHAVHQYGIGRLDPKFDARLRETYQKAIDKGLWKGTYAATDHKEYWAE